MTRPIKKLPPVTGPRYRAVFRNGVHTVFDRNTWSHGRALNTAKQAERVADDLNAGRL